MGMFDWVDAAIDCPRCGESIGGFQTKECRNQLDTVQPSETGNFYSQCDGCGLYVDFYTLDYWKKNRDEQFRDDLATT